MKKLLLLTATIVALNAAEFEFGKGNFTLNGGFAGINKELSSDVTTFSLVEQHKNLFSSKWFYKYNITWIDSKKLTSAQSTINSALSSTIIPQVDYKVEGLDINLVIGKDVVSDANKSRYVGVGLLVGASFPYVKSDNSSSSDGQKILKDSKTKIITYKLGINVNAGKKIKKFDIYGYGSWAYQTGRVKNEDVDTSVHTNGEFREVDIGVRFTPLKSNLKIWKITLTPKIYFTAGYRYSYWKLKDVKINVTGVDFAYNSSDLEMSNSILYVGAGYDF